MEERHIMNEPPMRVTLVYGGVAVYILCAAAFSTLLELHYGITISLVLIMLIIREPLIVFWATKITEGNQRIDREEQRQKILQVELEEARKRQEQMKKERQQIDDQDNKDDQIDQISLAEDEIKIILEDEDNQIEQLNVQNLLKRSNKILPVSKRKVAWTARTSTKSSV